MTNETRLAGAPVTPMLEELALDLRWSWRPEIRELFRAIDPERQVCVADDPSAILRLAPPRRLEELSADPGFEAAVRRLDSERVAYAEGRAWYRQTHGATDENLVAYFSAEVGLDEALPLYSGGLGVLAGDHLKSASALGVPLVAVTLLYSEGYFRQQLDATGWQREYYPNNRFDLMPISQVRTTDGRPLTVEVPLPGRPLTLAVWRARVGRVELYLLDANVAANSPGDRGITAQLYGGDRETRLQQEMALGIGGWRALAALGLRPQLCHLNEGHAAFAVLERARDWMSTHGSSFEVARLATAAGNVFTTHTPVAAGFDAFEAELVRGTLAPYTSELGLSTDQLLDLGRATPGDPAAPLEMAVLALRFAGSANAVSQVHGVVSRGLFSGLFPRWPVREVPIGSVTNGVHLETWVSDSMRGLWERCHGQACWDGPDTAAWGDLGEVPDEELWATRNHERERLIRWVRERLAIHLAQQGASPERVSAAASVLDRGALTIGFARRFAEYKRPTLLLSQPDRLRGLLLDAERPVQLVVAGKAHPRDEAGKMLIAELVRFADDPAIRERIVFLDDYDLEHASHLVQGVDVWLNTPRYPMEASGTSGMKVLVNGGLNLSELDGWWAEAYDPAMGWALGDPGGEHAPDPVEAERLYRLLETEVVPAFYDRDAAGLPRSWLARVRASMASLTPRFSSNRMVREYVEGHYLPAAARARALSDGDGRAARELAAAQARLYAGWPSIAFGPTVVRGNGARARVVVPVQVDSVDPRDLVIQLYRDRVPGEASAPPVLQMQRGRRTGDGWTEYRIAPTDLTAPVDAYTARAIPRVALEWSPLALPLIAWQR